MKLEKYLKLRKKEKNFRINNFCKELGISRQTLSNYKLKRYKPQKNILEKIIELTTGAVQPNDFYDL